MIDKAIFETLFKVGDVIQSGGDPNRKNAARLEILAIDNERVHFQPLRRKNKQSIPYDYLQLLIDKFDEVNPSSIEKSVGVIRRQAHFKKDTTTEAYAYGFAKAYQSKATFHAPASNVVPDDAEVIPATRQGFQSSPVVRKAVEQYAMEIAQKHFRTEGYIVETFGKPFDLLCSRGSEKLYVEVKGTQGSGAEILLTKGEVKFHRDNPDAMALVVVSEIEVSEEGQASGGTCLINNAWVINEDSLTPYAFSYRI